MNSIEGIVDNNNRIVNHEVSIVILNHFDSIWIQLCIRIQPCICEPLVSDIGYYLEVLLLDFDGPNNEFDNYGSFKNLISNRFEI